MELEHWFTIIHIGYFGFRLLYGSGRIIAGSSKKTERCVGSSTVQDLINSSMYLQPYISQENFDRKHAHVLKRYMV